MHASRSDAIVIPCKAAGFKWATTRRILKSRPSIKPISAGELDVAWGEYIKLSKTTAQRVVRFWQVRESVKASEPAQMVSALPAA
jgi:hypothetical protein